MQSDGQCRPLRDDTPMRGRQREDVDNINSNYHYPSRPTPLSLASIEAGEKSDDDIRYDGRQQQGGCKSPSPGSVVPSSSFRGRSTTSTLGCDDGNTLPSPIMSPRDDRIRDVEDVHYGEVLQEALKRLLTGMKNTTIDDKDRKRVGRCFAPGLSSLEEVSSTTPTPTTVQDSQTYQFLESFQQAIEHDPYQRSFVVDHPIGTTEDTIWLHLANAQSGFKDIDIQWCVVTVRTIDRACFRQIYNNTTVNSTVNNRNLNIVAQSHGTVRLECGTQKRSNDATRAAGRRQKQHNAAKNSAAASRFVFSDQPRIVHQYGLEFGKTRPDIPTIRVFRVAPHPSLKRGIQNVLQSRPRKTPNVFDLWIRHWDSPTVSSNSSSSSISPAGVVQSTQVIGTVDEGYTFQHELVATDFLGRNNESLFELLTDLKKEKAPRCCSSARSPSIMRAAANRYSSPIAAKQQQQQPQSRRHSFRETTHDEEKKEDTIDSINTGEISFTTKDGVPATDPSKGQSQGGDRVSGEMLDSKKALTVNTDLIHDRECALLTNTAPNGNDEKNDSIADNQFQTPYLTPTNRILESTSPVDSSIHSMSEPLDRKDATPEQIVLTELAQILSIDPILQTLLLDSPCIESPDKPELPRLDDGKQQCTGVRTDSSQKENQRPYLGPLIRCKKCQDIKNRLSFNVFSPFGKDKQCTECRADRDRAEGITAK